MRNIPVFTVEAGVASLILEEIPYKKTAYVKLQATQMLSELLSECVTFCKIAGAEHVYATGHPELMNYPLYTIIYEMRILHSNLPTTECIALPVENSMLKDWVELYNKKMNDVPSVATMTYALAEKYVADRSAYYIYGSDGLIGLGVASGNRIDALASLIPGRGVDVLCALGKQLTGEHVILEVASTNQYAMSLYQRIGFYIEKEISRWHIISDVNKKHLTTRA